MDDSDEFGRRVASGDASLFGAVPSETTARDRQALLALHAAVRAEGDYIYLEIGSHLGGSLQAHCQDPRCRRIYSIDKRTAAQRDLRGLTFAYRNNSSARMLAALRAALGAKVGVIVTLDCDAAAVPPAAITERPRLCFIDAEHTTAAVIRDFAFCRAAMADGIIAFHDAQIVHRAIARCRRQLQRDGRRFRALKLPGAVYALLLGDAVEREGARLAAVAESDVWFRMTASLAFAGAVVAAWWGRFELNVRAMTRPWLQG
ncbi:MAG TPA: class I SAM-dependent methyltransferase [Opitutus sp.]|nr:class I SAM-dependent methyltransferase [Opitutus sp.]